MKKDKDLDLIFQKWRASLAERDRTFGSVSENFGDLFYDLKRMNVDYNVANEYMKKACEAHYPSRQIAKDVYKRIGKSSGKTEEEFTKSWCDNIKSKAINVMHEFFDLPFEDNKTNAEVKREKARIKSSAKINDYLEQFEPVDLSQLRKMREESKKFLEQNENLEFLDD